MADVTVRELRNDGGRVLDRVVRGESLTVTRDGHAPSPNSGRWRGVRFAPLRC